MAEAFERNFELNLPATWPPDYPRHRPVSASEARALDQAATASYGIPSLVLMEHASRGIADIAAALTEPEGHILVCCGPGNNGGDGYGAARFLRDWGRSVVVLQMSREPPRSDDAALQFRLAGQMGPIEPLWGVPGGLERALQRDPALIVDALFGVGLSRPMEGPFPAWIETLNAWGAPVLSVDLPSGMHPDSGLGLTDAVQAALTVTMAVPKLGFAADAPGAPLAGHVIEADISLPRPLLRELELPEGDPAPSASGG